MSKYSVDVDKKWQKKWEETQLYKFDESNPGKKLYCLEMFSYPSGAKLHLGHWFNYGPVDSWARFKRLQGYNIFQPMGFDAFGLPAENYAIKTGIHPEDSTLKNIDTMEKQLKAMGAMFNWENEVKTCLPDYYKWTQWVFLKLYEKGLAYKKEAPVNWCPSCNTVLANEQVVNDGHCERCNTEVTKRNLSQWFLKITDYSEELLEKLDTLDWPERTKAMQKHWIGKSTGSEVTFKVVNSDVAFNVFTTRVDTLFGVTYVVLAPENPLVEKITTPEQKSAVAEYQEMAKKASDIERQSNTREKTGVFTGSYAINPATNEQVPIWVADYVLATYGTGCVMAVPAHDERDFDFAAKYSLPIKRVITSKKGNGEEELPFVEYGKLINSGNFDDITTEDAKEKIVEFLETKNLGNKKINYRLRDWLVSRQRYWGAPIPIVYCDDCGAVPVPEKDLPVRLPYNVDFTPDGKSPLAKSPEFLNTVCPKCGKPAKREVDTLDTFVCSSWYYLRYPDNNNSEKAFDPEIINKMLPVDKYVGGPEHACMHLLYARFITKALRDMGYLNFDEPFLSLVHQGLILGPDGNKMSKSKGNVVAPDEYIDQYGSDVFRMYLMFGFAYIEGGAWSDDGIKAIARFVERIERLIHRANELKTEGSSKNFEKPEKELNFVRHSTIKSVTSDTEKFQFNTSIARMMEFVNALYKYDSDFHENMQRNGEFFNDSVKDLVILLAPFAPHFAEECWSELGLEYSIFNQEWPKFDEASLVKDSIELGVQINGKVKTRVEVPANSSEDEIKAIALGDEKVKNFVEGKTIRKMIIIKNSIINIVVG